MECIVILRCWFGHTAGSAVRLESRSVAAGRTIRFSHCVHLFSPHLPAFHAPGPFPVTHDVRIRTVLSASGHLARQPQPHGRHGTALAVATVCEADATAMAFDDEPRQA